MNNNNEDFTIQSCIEITKYIEKRELYSYSEIEVIKLIKSIFPKLGLKDKYQLQRFEILLGIQQLAFDESLFTYNFPAFGYHKVGDENAKLFNFRGAYNNSSTCSLMKKMNKRNSSDEIVGKVFLILLEEARTNQELLKYLKLLGSPEPVTEE